jgi:IgGFc binding protein
MRVGWLALLVAVAAMGACGSSDSGFPPPLESPPATDAGSGADVPSLLPIVAPTDDPQTCGEAAQWQSYVGCDYWPTVLANNVWSIFDFAVVVANAGSAPASVTITGPGGTSQAQTVAPDALAKFYLPWVPALKGPDADVCGTAVTLASSVVAQASAYHLVSSVPVTVYQFNALEYAGKGGPAGKDWSSCPGFQECMDPSSPNHGVTVGCYSFTNDSSLLLPTTALTPNYRVTAYTGQVGTAGYVAITATTASTHVKVSLSANANIVAGPGVLATTAGDELDLTLDAGDVAQLVTEVGAQYDLSGSLITADQPIQVLSGAACDEIPAGAPACDHLEQSVFPAETLGKQYFVNLPSGPTGQPVGHVVRLYGNVDGTTLTYAPAAPTGCPATLDAGQVVDCGVVESEFEVTGSNAFAVGTFMLGGSIVDPSGGLGDPSQSMLASVEQYRTKYVFLAPTDYDLNLIDVIAPTGAELVLDGATVDWGSVTAIADGYDIWRVGLLGTAGGAHTLEASTGVGIQVLGYGLYTSYQYPGGLNLKRIAPPPPPNQ